MKTPLILVSNPVSRQALTALHRTSQNGEPRIDYLELAQRLHGDIYGLSNEDGKAGRYLNRMQKAIRIDLAGAAAAARHSGECSAFLSMSEKVALPLAGLLRFEHAHAPHIVIGHKLSTGFKTYLFRSVHLHRQFARVITVSRLQADYARKELGFTPASVDFVYNGVDTRFFAPMAEEPEDYVLSVGQEQRDFATLIQALSGTGIRLLIVSSSPWSTDESWISEAENTTVVRRIPYTELRRLYARARVVVAPLHAVDYAAGVNTLLEGMAMARPVIITHTPGIDGYVDDGETALYVPAGSVEAMRHQLLHVYGNPDEQRRLGSNARQQACEKFNLDDYVERVAQIVGRTIAAPV